MSMVDNFAEQLNALRRFIYSNAPVMSPRLEDIEHQTHFMNLEFRRDDVSCVLFVELSEYSATSVMDEQGNRWRQYTVVAQPSWPSYGSVPVSQAQAFIKLLAEVTDFGDRMMKEFSQPITKLIETAEQIAERKRKSAEETARFTVTALMRENHKGMRVGQERHLVLPPEAQDLLPIGEVSYWDGNRKYTTHVTAKRAILFSRVE